MKHLEVTLGLLLAFALLLARPAAADPAAQARFHDERARAHYDKGRFEPALQEFFLEQRVAPNPRITFNIALCFEQLRRHEESFQFFDEYLASADADAERRTYASKALETLSSKVARVTVHTSPPGADIFIDRKEHGSYGKTPRVLAVAPGDHQVWVELPGYRSAAATFSVKQGEQSRVELSPDRILGKLSFTSTVPGDAIVRAPDGALAARGPTPLLVDLAPGTYALNLAAAGYLPWTGVAAVRPEQATEASAAPLAEPAETSEITVTSNVPGALVELDGEPAGFSPTVLSSLNSGAHKLRLRATGTVPWSGDVDVKKNERAWVTVSLEEPPTVHRSGATWVVGGIGAAALAASGVLAILSADAHRDFEEASATSDRSDLKSRGVTLNTAADVLLVTGLAALGAGVVLYFTTAETRGRDSSAAVAKTKR